VQSNRNPAKPSLSWDKALSALCLRCCTSCGSPHSGHGYDGDAVDPIPKIRSHGELGPAESRRRFRGEVPQRRARGGSGDCCGIGAGNRGAGSEMLSSWGQNPIISQTSDKERIEVSGADICKDERTLFGFIAHQSIYRKSPLICLQRRTAVMS